LSAEPLAEPFEEACFLFGVYQYDVCLYFFSIAIQLGEGANAIDNLVLWFMATFPEYLVGIVEGREVGLVAVAVYIR